MELVKIEHEIYSINEVEENQDLVSEKETDEERVTRSHARTLVKRRAYNRKTRFAKAKRELRKPSENDFRCYICNELFDLIKSKNEHIILDHPDIDRCGVCDRSYKTPLATERHIKSHYVRDNIFLCPVCADTFCKKYSLDRHLAQCHGGVSRQYYCDLCPNWKSHFWTNLKRHMRTVHLNIKEHRCPHIESCPDKFFTTKAALNFHLIGHHNLVLFKCTNCYQKFDTENDLKGHNKRGRCVQRPIKRRSKIMKNDEAVLESLIGFSCELCKKEFTTKAQFRVHFHQKHKSNLNCKVCNKKFTQHANLIRHVRVSFDYELKLL